ncbi:MAG: DNA polymerase Y family protein [Croceibacterium sp.]
MPRDIPPRRIMAIWLPRLAVDRWRQAQGCAAGEGADAEAVALVTETAHGPRIDAANAAALAVGAQAGMRVADARALCPALKVMPSDKAGDLAFLERLALWAQRWGPWTALDAPDGLLVDVSAVAHLFGGEARLLADAQDRFAAQGLAARLAIAPTAGAAWALAHHGPGQAILPPGDHAETRLAALPVAALRLDADVLLVLRRLGLKRLGDVSGIGRDALQRRFRKQRSPAANPLLRMDQLLGRVAEPLLPVVAAMPAVVRRGLLEPIRHRELLDQVVADLAADMARELERRGEGARRLQLGLWRVDGDVVVRDLELAAATRNPAHIARLFAARLDHVEAGFGIELVQMRAAWAEPLALAQADLEAAAEVQGTSLADCIDRLNVRLGADAVRRPVAFASHIPERAQRWQAPLAPEPASQGELMFHTRPLKLLARAEPIAVLYATPDGYPRQFRWRGGVHEVVRVEGPERIAPEWWREKGTARLRDYYRIEDSLGRRYWIYRAGLAGDGRGGPPDWFLQGLCG